MILTASTFYRHLCSLISNPKGVRFLLAISGGKDSSVLAHLFYECNLQFAMAHCNFHLRDDDSDSDMEWVKKMADTYQKELFIKEFDTFLLQENSGKSIEMVARELRYDWFREIGKEYDYIVTAHHANDNAETLILNLSRGTGLRGLTGIPIQNGKILRPLLPFLSDEIERYAVENKIRYCLDITNFSEKYNRNKIRLSIIPKLYEINPEVIDTFTQNIARFRQQYNFYSRQILHFQEEITSFQDGICYISIKKLLQNEDKELLLYEFLKKYNFNASVVQNIIENLNNEPGKIFYSLSHELLKDREYLIIKELQKKEFSAVTLKSIEEFEKYNFSVTYHSTEQPFTFEKDSRYLYVDVDKIHFPILLRNWQKGDYFYPLGMRGKKKLSDFFVDKKTNLFAKQEIKLLCIDNQIVWVVGQRADDRFKIDKNTKHYYKIVYYGRI